MTDVIIHATDGGAFDGYLATPKSGKGPGIVVIQEIFGVNDVMRGITDSLAAAGFTALCPDLFWRVEPNIDITDQTPAEWKYAMQLLEGFEVDDGIADLLSTLAFLRKHPSCSGKVGSVGFCLGGKLAFLMATRSDADCNVSYYGVGLDELLGEAGAISKPAMLHIAEKDQFVPPPAQDKIKAALAGNPLVTLHSYPGADHAFARIGGEHFDQAAADLANGRTLEFLHQHLGA